jgi:hypothetical protein
MRAKKERLEKLITKLVDNRDEFVKFEKHRPKIVIE